ncbi:MAG: hypothetical protein KBD65_00660 [Candidatus Moranbacteria bacterium]|nr:hypothetical protein [Candidatus Moranbacteria bacterium]
MVVTVMTSPLLRLPPDPNPARTAREYEEIVARQQQGMPAFRQRMLEAARRAEKARDAVLLLLCG